MELKILKDLIDVKRGDRVTATELREAKGTKYPFFNGVKSTGFWDEFNTEKDVINAVSYGGQSGTVSITKEKCFIGDAVFRVYINKPNSLVNKYLYYFLIFKQDEIKNEVRTGAIRGLPKEAIWNLQIPLPPLNQQQKIVNFLDKWTTLIDKLETEQAKRTEQFNFYLNNWLTQAKGKAHKFLDLLSITKGEIVNADKVLQKGKYPIYKAGTTYSGFYDEKNSNGNVITIVTYGASSGYINFINEEFFLGGGRSLLELKNNKTASYRFIYFYLKWKQDTFLKSKNVGAITNLDKNIFKDFMFQLPPLQIQEKIANNLDVLNTLTFDNLPKEIELRKQQYKHYLNTIFQHLT